MCVILMENGVEGPRNLKAGLTALGSGHLLPGIHPEEMEPACQRNAGADATCSTVCNHHSRRRV